MPFDNLMERGLGDDESCGSVTVFEPLKPLQLEAALAPGAAGITWRFSELKYAQEALMDELVLRILAHAASVSTPDRLLPRAKQTTKV